MFFKMCKYFLRILCIYHSIDVEIVEQTIVYYYLSRAHGTLGLVTSCIYCLLLLLSDDWIFGAGAGNQWRKAIYILAINTHRYLD